MSLHIDSEWILWIGNRGGLSSFDRKDIFTDYSKLSMKNYMEDKVIEFIIDINIDAKIIECDES